MPVVSWCTDDAASSSKPKPRRPRRDRSEMPAGTKTAYAGQSSRFSDYVSTSQRADVLPHRTAIAKGKRQRWAKWTSTEDAHLVALIQEHGLNEWDKIGHAMPHDDETKEKRTGDSCQARWNHYLCKKEEYRVWSEGMLERAWVEGKGAELDEEERRKEIEKKKAEMEKTRGALWRAPLSSWVDRTLADASRPLPVDSSRQRQRSLVPLVKHRGRTTPQPSGEAPDERMEVDRGSTRAETLGGELSRQVVAAIVQGWRGGGKQEQEDEC